MAKIKSKTSRYHKVETVEHSTGLWSFVQSRTVRIEPVGETELALARFLPEDLVRWQTWPEMQAAMAAKGWEKSASRKLAEYEAQCRGEVVDEAGNESWLRTPMWLRAWRRYGQLVPSVKTQRRPEDVRLMFGCGHAGFVCGEETIRKGRMFFLKLNGVKHLAVMLKEGWWGWEIIQKFTEIGNNVAPRAALLKSGAVTWRNFDAGVVFELVKAHQMCLFKIAEDPVLDAVMDEPGAEKTARLVRTFAVNLERGGGEVRHYHLAYSVEYNPGRTHCENMSKDTPREFEVLRERKIPWTKRPVEVSRVEDVAEVARKVALANGCAVMPVDASDELRLALGRALMFVTFPDRSPTAPGGLLNGYMLVGRMLRHAAGKIRGDTGETIVRHRQKQAVDALAKKRELVVDTMLRRLVRAAGIDAETASAAVRDAPIYGELRGMLEVACRKLGMLEGNPLNLFKPVEQAGILKLPDLSLAIAAELKGAPVSRSPGSAALFTQASPIRPLPEASNAFRWSRSGEFAAVKCWSGFRIGGIAAGSVRVLRDGETYYVMAFPQYVMMMHGRDLHFDPANEKSVPIPAFRFESEGGERSRGNLRIACDLYAWDKIRKRAEEKRIVLYRVDFGALKPLADLAYSADNAAPCHVAAEIPEIVDDGANPPVVRTTFIMNPHCPREARRPGIRSWIAYLGQHPADRGRNLVYWPAALAPEGRKDAGADSLPGALSRVVETDGVLLTDKEHWDEAQAAAGYFVMPGRGPQESGGAYNAYQLQDRVFNARDGRVDYLISRGTYRATENGAFDAGNWSRVDDVKRRGKLLVDAVPADKIPELEKLFAGKIEADPISQNRHGGKKAEACERRKILGRPLKIESEDWKRIVAREFRRIVFSGSMSYEQQLRRPAHEVAVGLWLSTLEKEDAK